MMNRQQVQKKSSNELYGWICPKCGAVLSPWTSSCINCRGDWTPMYGWNFVYPSTQTPIITKDKVEITC